MQICKVGDTQVCEATEKNLLAEETPVPVLPIERLEAVETADQEWEEHHVVAEEVDKIQDEEDLRKSQECKQHQEKVSFPWMNTTASAALNNVQDKQKRQVSHKIVIDVESCLIYFSFIVFFLYDCLSVVDQADWWNKLCKNTEANDTRMTLLQILVLIVLLLIEFDPIVPVTHCGR